MMQGQGGRLRVDIRIDDPTAPAPALLLREHLADLALSSPPESMHALDAVALCSLAVTFWTAWQATELLGCGALLELDPTHGEIKSMRTVSRHRRKGVGAALLEHIIAEARRRGYGRLSLETGSMPPFAAARALYTRFDFVPCPPFGHYVRDPNSVFMTRAL